MGHHISRLLSPLPSTPKTEGREKMNLGGQRERELKERKGKLHLVHFIVRDYGMTNRIIYDIERLKKDI